MGCQLLAVMIVLGEKLKKPVCLSNICSGKRLFLEHGHDAENTSHIWLVWYNDIVR